jgi:hypothetical protein
MMRGSGQPGRRSICACQVFFKVQDIRYTWVSPYSTIGNGFLWKTRIPPLTKYLCPSWRIYLHLPLSGLRCTSPRKAERALRRGHPWLFDQSITRQSRQGSPGDIAVIFDSHRQFLAVGLYDPHSLIRVRVLQHGKPAPIESGWFREKLAAAALLREPLQNQPSELSTTGYRLVHGENDGLPGLVIDRYAGTLVIKLYTLAWLPHLKNIIRELLTIVPVERLVLRLSRAVDGHGQDLYGLDRWHAYLWSRSVCPGNVYGKRAVF